VSENCFPALVLSDWLSTRDTIHAYAKVIGDVRRVYSIRQKHWGNQSLRVTATGITTRPLNSGALVFELLLDLTVHQLVLTTHRGELWRQPLHGQSGLALCEQMLAALGLIGLHPELDRSLFSTATGAYDVTAIARFWQALTRLDTIFKRFKAELREETSPVELWPEHFDLAMLWFSGRRIPGQDPANAEWSDEQMNFGFVTGDATIPEPYFYATAYPLPPDLPNTQWPSGAYWHDQGWRGAVLKYAALVAAPDPDEKLLTFLRATHQSGSSRMR
jgi:hypothetical protein